MSDPNQGQVASAAWEALHGDGPTDNVFNSHRLIRLFKDGGYTIYSDGGRLFEFPVEYATNPTFKSYGELETLDTTRIDTFDAARYEQRIHAGTVVFSDLEQLRNAVSNRKFDIVKRKLKNGTESAMESLNGQLFSDGTGNNGKDWDGIGKIIPDDPTAGTVGGISRAAWAFFRSRAAAGTKTTNPFDNLRSVMESVFNQCTLGGTTRRPTGAVTSRTVFEGYKTLLTQIESLVKDSGGNPEADLGFDNDEVAFNGIGLGYDEQATPTDNLWFVNKNFLQLTVLKGAWLKMKDPIDPYNQLSTVHKVVTVGNLCTSGSRHQGVVYDIT